MNGLPKYRAQPWKTRPRRRFATAKPRQHRGNLRKERVCCKAAKHGTAAGQPSSRRLNRLPEWTDPNSHITKGGRHRLKGKDYERLRGDAYIRSQGKCECGCGRNAIMGYPRMHPHGGELAHKEHGPRKSDELSRVLWKNWLCHEWEHNCGGKPVPKKERVNAVPN